LASVVVLGALDTKGREVEFLTQLIKARGHQTVTVDTGVLGSPLFPADVSRRQVAEAGGYPLDELISAGDRGAAVTAVSKGVVRVIEELHAAGRVDAIVAMGGGAGTTVGTAAMRALPLGIPKVMVSTLASGDVRGFVGVKDIVMIPAIVDISGLNRISRGVFARAAGAVCGMLDAAPDSTAASPDAPLIAASMFGNTTPCVERARGVLEAQGYELLVFHATGQAGRRWRGSSRPARSARARRHDNGVGRRGGRRCHVGRPASARGCSARRHAGCHRPGMPGHGQLLGPESLPAHLRAGRLYQHNAKQTLVRTTPEENVQLGEIIAAKLNASSGPVAVYLPLRGVSVISAEGKPFHWPEADRALFDTLKSRLRPDIPCREMDCHINDAPFAEAMAQHLLAMCGSVRV
jgi:uncharacterized protein (UPF0261 family)